jgi:DNA mismatch endonuclease (patch repair protein)
MAENPETRSRIMRAIRSAGTTPERQLGAAMWAAGLRYRKQGKHLPGRPDFVFAGPRVAVFVDGDFWHGRHWPPPPGKFGDRRAFWVAKIERNRARDSATNARLAALGWLVLRFWATEVQANAPACAAEVRAWVQARRHSHAQPPLGATYPSLHHPTDEWLAADEGSPYG